MNYTTRRSPRSQPNGLSLLLALVIAGCGNSQEPDANSELQPGLEPGDAPCDAEHAGARIHLTFTSNEIGNSGGQCTLGLTVNGNSECYLFLPVLDDSHKSTVVIRYREGTQGGPATVLYYATMGVENFEGSANFTAATDDCVDVELAIEHTFIDAGGADTAP